MITRRFLLASLAMLPLLAHPVRAETAAATNATPLTAGANRGAADSFQGDHLWYFVAEPGSFQLNFALGGSTGDSALGGAVSIAVQFGPGSQKGRLTRHDSPSGSTFDGSTDQRAKVFILIEPPHSPLVRAARNYTLEVTGAVSFGGKGGAAAGAGGDPIVGVYMSKRNDYGATKFEAGGHIVTSSGRDGRWALFDEGTHLYTLTIGRDRFSARLVPGRGLIEPSNDYTLFEPQR